MSRKIAFSCPVWLAPCWHAVTAGVCCDRMSELWQEITQDFERYGFFLEVKGSQEKRQQGIFR